MHCVLLWLVGKSFSYSIWIVKLHHIELHGRHDCNGPKQLKQQNQKKSKHTNGRIRARWEYGQIHDHDSIGHASMLGSVWMTIANESQMDEKGICSCVPSYFFACLFDFELVKPNKSSHTNSRWRRRRRHVVRDWVNLVSSSFFPIFFAQ